MSMPLPGPAPGMPGPSPQPTMPPPGPPDQPGGPGALPGPAGLPPEIQNLVAAVIRTMATVGPPPPVVLVVNYLLFLASHGPESILRFLRESPQGQVVALRAFLADYPAAVQRPLSPEELAGQAGPGGPMGGPAPNGPPVGAPPGELVGAGPGEPVGAPPGAPPGGPLPGGPLPGALPPGMGQPGPRILPPPGRGGPGPGQAQGPKLKPKPPGPKPYELPDLDEVRSIYAKQPPTWERVMRDAFQGRQRWQERNKAILRQADLYHGVEDRRDVHGRPINEGAGGSYFKLSRATTIVDRLIGDALPTDEVLVRDLPPRADDEETRDAAQGCENWLRTLDEEDADWWASLASQGVITPPLPRKRIGMLALEGAQGVAFRLQPRASSHFVVKEPVNITELYPLGLATTRQSFLTFDAALALYPEILDHLIASGYDDSSPDGRGGVSDGTLVKVIGWSDKDGLWRCICWDWANPGAVAEGLRAAPAKDGGRWILPPTRIDYGFCYYQIGTYWNASPAAAGQGETGYAAQAGRGALAAHVATLEELTKIASALKTNFMQNLHPAWVRKLRDITEDRAEPKFGINEVNDLYLDEEMVPLYINATGTPDGQATMAILAGELADLMPPVLAGRGASESGFDRSLQQQQAGNLHLDQLKACYAADMARFDSLTLQLALRKGLGKGRAWKSLSYRQFKGGDQGTEGEMTPEMIRRAGVRVKVRYHEVNLDAELQLNQIHLERLKSDVQSLSTTRRKLGVDDPDREEELVVTDKIISANPRLQDALSQDALRNTDYDLYLAYVQSQAPGPGQGGGGGMPGTAPSMGPRPGVMAAGLPPTMQAR